MLVGLATHKATHKAAPKSGAPGSPPYDAAESLEELAVLASSAGAEVLQSILQTRPAPDAATLIGAGKVAELAELVAASQADVVLFDRDLAGPQTRNLERELKCKVLDRTQLILDIFAHRARTREGQLQVELAQLNYLLPRLTGKGLAMSRLGGGIGTRGPGETKLETDRRRIWTRISKIEQQLKTVRSTRTIQRKKRESVPLATVALVGYTNAGKSSLFNRLTGAGVLADAKMFATLDPTVRHIVLPSRRRALLSDTVGFIRNLPTTLVKAFRATLEEVTEAALLLHVVDAASPHAEAHFAHVLEVLDEIGAAGTPQLVVLNKTDLLPGEAAAEMAASLGNRLAAQRGGSGPALELHQVASASARTGEGLDRLLDLMDSMLDLDRVSEVRLHLPASDGAALHMIHEYGRPREIRYDDSGVWIIADLPQSVQLRLKRYLRRAQPVEEPSQALI
ncbi:MAG: GTPase HflX [Acidobacteria bacterium]|nr:GTPase HflX [Acidobacteriota bacterium]